MTLLDDLYATLTVDRVLTPCGVQEGEKFAIDRSPFTLGRNSDCDLKLSHSEISRRHLQFVAEGEILFVEDLGSENGTWLNGERLAHATRRRVQTGNTLQVGYHVIFRFADPNTTPKMTTRPVALDDITVDLLQPHVVVAGRDVSAQLNAVQYRILQLFATVLADTQYDRLILFDSIVAAGWPEAPQGAGVTRSAVHSQMSRLTRILATAAGGHAYFSNRKGQGYHFQPRSKPPADPA